MLHNLRVFKVIIYCLLFTFLIWWRITAGYFFAHCQRDMKTAIAGEPRSCGDVRTHYPRGYLIDRWIRLGFVARWLGEITTFFVLIWVRIWKTVCLLLLLAHPQLEQRHPAFLNHWRTELFDWWLCKDVYYYFLPSDFDWWLLFGDLSSFDAFYVCFSVFSKKWCQTVQIVYAIFKLVLIICKALSAFFVLN